MNTYSIKTFGCQMNLSDSERIAGFLEKKGLKKTADTKSADLIIFNTCGVRQMAEDRVYGQLHNLRIKNKKSKIALTGCLADRKDVQRRLRGKVDLFFLVSNLNMLKDWMVKNSLEIRNSKFEIQGRRNKPTDKETIAYLSIKPRYSNSFRAYVPIMTGCNNFCSYCVVPYARGREVSRNPEEIISEVKKLVKNGYKEILLLGQNVNSYSFEKTNFSKLLEKINAIPGKFWINFISNHPKDITNEFIETVTRLKKVCELIHLPLQAGDDEIIREMNRKYTAKKYLALALKIKKAFAKNKPETPFSITTDIIVGFPGETRSKFLKSAEIMEKVNYDMVFFGQYSPRPGTAAWNMKDTVSKKEKERRENHLNEILKKTAFENNKKLVGKTLEVLVTATGSKSPSNGLLEPGTRTYFGRTRNGKNIRIVSKKGDLIGNIIKAKVIKANIWNLEGETR